MARPKKEVPWLDRRDNGVYYAYWPRPDSPKPGCVSLRTKDAGEAQDRFSAFLIERSRFVGESAPSNSLTAELALLDYRREHVEESVVDTDRIDYCIQNLIPHFGPMVIRDISIPDSRAYWKRREGGEIGNKSGPGTIRRELGVLVAAFNHAVKWKRLDKNDVPFIEKPPRPPAKDKVLTRDEVARWIDAAEGRTKLFIQLAYYTASRKSAIFQLSWFQVDMDHLTIQLNASGRKQTKKVRPTVPIVAPLIEPLRAAHAAKTTEWVLGYPGDVKRSLETACRKAGIGHVSPHVLRHSRAVHLAQDGVDLYAIAGLLGDSLETVARNYLHHCPDHLRSALEKSEALTVG